MDRSSGDGEELLAVVGVPAAVAFSDVQGDGEGGAIELVGEEIGAFGEGGGELDDAGRKGEGFLVDI